ncbi:LysR family transcriptional regulator [Streptomyces spectabilis]|uniref:DNA-binding transcriptional LysR family regulator n=1 Tax=Streptomyces spectabilis TaxID=68270 RepID=A0A5P2XFR2_STRST|nr:LysR family transcriptional regulator [Streptomyces spectabilis]MBB5105260.1 DNA-binding transcriptional LysR family regulator [Streptomyces spectabilis]MCI3906454.1 LysR family transcriptional regulator [Streptomyces spectabilis]QEV63298.1 LysR family transcriptional regulator [Streptomyces spectabilis]GGV51569.1 LysR family transcriptional regulator [Streptomyces spectabilis]
MQRDIEVKLLRTLLAVVNEDGFSRAAQSLHVTQPTVSQQIQRLESIVRAPVFQRAKRPPMLTPVGRELVAHARRVIMLNNDVISRVSALSSQDSFTMGCSTHFADGLGTMLTRLAVERPHMRCSMVTGQSSALADGVRTGELEAALLLGTATPRSDLLGRLRLDWFGHASLTAGKRIPIALLGGRSALSLHIAETLNRNSVPWYSLTGCADPVALLASVQAGLAYTALCANAHVKQPAIRQAPPGSLGPAPAPLPVYLAFSATARESVVDAARVAARTVLESAPVSPP